MSLKVEDIAKVQELLDAITTYTKSIEADATALQLAAEEYAEFMGESVKAIRDGE